MADFKEILLLGAGAVGLIPAAGLLALPEISLRVAADAGRVVRYRKDGIFFNGRRMEFDFVSPGEQECRPADLVIVAVKGPDLEKALDNLEGMVTSSTVFLPLLNGISAHEVIARRFPGTTVLRGFFLGHASVRVNNQVSHDGCGTIYFGGECTAARKVLELFSKAMIDAEIPEDIEVAQWQKFILNVGINQTQAFYRAGYGAVQKSPEMLGFAAKLMEEALAVARAAGVAVGDEVIDSALLVICKMPGEVKTSMLQDVEAGRPTEINEFAGTVCRLAGKFDIDVPCNRQVLDALKNC